MYKYVQRNMYDPKQEQILFIEIHLFHKSKLSHNNEIETAKKIRIS